MEGCKRGLAAHGIRAGRGSRASLGFRPAWRSPGRLPSEPSSIEATWPVSAIVPEPSAPLRRGDRTHREIDRDGRRALAVSNTEPAPFCSTEPHASSEARRQSGFDEIKFLIGTYFDLHSIRCGPRSVTHRSGERSHRRLRTVSASIVRIRHMERPDEAARLTEP